MSTLLHRLAAWAQAEPQAPAQRYKAGGEWRTVTAQEFRDRVYHFALYLRSHGIGPGHTGAILSYNRPEWAQMELGLTLAGARSVGLYPNSTAKDIRYILEHTESVILGVQDGEYLRKAGDLPAGIRQLLVLGQEGNPVPNSISFLKAVEEGARLARQAGSETWDGLLNRLDPQAGAFLIYTSGTTGTPKGALLSHANLVFTGDEIVRHWKLPAAPQTMFSFLPLCHIAEKLQSLCVGLSQRYTISFASKFEAVGTEITEVQPTILLCVPRLWEKMMEGVEAKLRHATTARRKLAQWAMAVGARISAARLAKRFPSPWDLAQWEIAQRVVVSKVKAALGLRNCQWAASGAAPLSGHVSRWFRSLGVEILEDYGQTESTGMILMTQPGVESAGSVGVPPSGIDFKLAEDGEILTRGPHVFLGYLKNEEATRETVVNGWLHTGDLGEVDSRGLIRIKGRKKEIMKTSGGKMIAPVPLEERIKELPLIGQACMVGDNRKYLSVLLTLSEEAQNRLRGRAQAIEGELVKDETTLVEIRAHLDRLNQTLATFERIKRFAVVARDFSIERDEMTPSLKMKRSVIERNYQAVIDSLYEGPGER